MIERLLRQSVQVVRMGPGAADEYNTPEREEQSRATSDAWLEQTSATEVTVGRNTVISEWLLVLPAGVGIDGGDRVEYEGAVYEVLGSPDRVRTPRGEHHVEARLRLVENG